MTGAGGCWRSVCAGNPRSSRLSCFPLNVMSVYRSKAPLSAPRSPKAPAYRPLMGQRTRDRPALLSLSFYSTDGTLLFMARFLTSVSEIPLEEKEKKEEEKKIPTRDHLTRANRSDRSALIVTDPLQQQKEEISAGSRITSTTCSCPRAWTQHRSQVWNSPRDKTHTLTFTVSGKQSTTIHK